MANKFVEHARKQETMFKKFEFENTPPKMWSELGKDETGKIRLWKVCEMGRIMSSKKSKMRKKPLQSPQLGETKPAEKYLYKPNSLVSTDKILVKK